MFNHSDLAAKFRAHTLDRLPAGARTLYETSTRNFLAGRTRPHKPIPTKALGGEPLAALGTPQRFYQERELKRAINMADVIDRASLRQHGFRDFGDFLHTVRHSSMRENKGRPDPRLIQNAAPSTTGNESVGADGGFAVPPQFVGEVVRKILQSDSLLLATDARTTQTNSLTIPKDETTPWQSSGGIQALWEDELDQNAQSKPSLTSGTLKLNKLVAFVPITDELADDSNALVEHVSAKAPEKIAFAIESAIIGGGGAGRPKGILASAGTVVVAEESGQTAATINEQNVLKMWNRTLPNARRNGTWLCHPDADLQLQQLVHAGSAGDVAAAAPIYQPPSALAPNGSILGRPIYFSEACSAVGTSGDIIFGDLSAYLTATKMMRSDVSIHLWFDFDVIAYRFVLRIGGQPWTDQLAPSLKGGVSRGFFSTLASRS
jgi:HK97 family phage major capsid protein